MLGIARPTAGRSDRGNASNRGNAKVIVIAIVAIAAIAAIVWFVMKGGGGAGTKAAAEFVPKDVQGYGAVDLDGLRKSAIYAAFKTEIDAVLQQPEVKASMDKAGLTEDSISSVVLGLGELAGAEPKLVMAIKGSFDENKFIAASKEQLGEGAKEKDLGGTKFVYAEGQGVGMAVGGPGTVLVGTEDLVGRALQVKAGSGESVSKNEGLVAIAGAVDTGATLWMAGAIPAEAKGAAAMIPGGFNQIANATHFAVSIDVSGDLVLKAAVKLASKEDAEAVASQVKGFAGMAKAFTSEAPAEIKGDLDAILDSLSAEASAETTIISARMSKDAVERMTKMAKEGGLQNLL